MSEIPLSPPNGGGQCIGITALSPADVIISTTNAVVSKAIKFGTGSLVSHAMLYIGNGYVIEAIGDGVVRRPLQQAVHEASLAVALRHGKVESAIATRIISIARQWVGKKYDTSGALGAGTCIRLGVACSGSWNAPSKFFCSELVLEAYKKSGISLLRSNPATSNPGQIADAYVSGHIGYVGHLKS